MDVLTSIQKAVVARWMLPLQESDFVEYLGLVLRKTSFTQRVADFPVKVLSNCNLSFMTMLEKSSLRKL